MGDLNTWRAKHRELIFACRVLRDRFGQAAVDAVAAQHMKNIREATARRARETGRTGLDALLDGFDRISETHDHQIVEHTARRLEIKVTRCAHCEMFAEWNALDLGLAFMCSGDVAVAEGLNPKIRLERPELLMRGDRCCRFIYTLDG